MRTRAALAILVLSAGGAAAWYFRSHRTQAPSAATAASYTRTFDRHPRRWPAVILVNDSPDATVGAGVPVYVQAVLRNPTDAAVALAAAPAVRIEVHDRGAATPVKATFTRIGEWPVDVPAHGEAVVSWTLAEMLAAGEYDVSAAGAASWVTDPGLRLDLAPARVTVSRTAVPDQTEAAAIRVLMLQDRAQDALARLEAALAKPDAPLLWHLWRADALETLNRGAEARDALTALAERIATRQRQAGQAVELPFWLAERLDAARR